MKLPCFRPRVGRPEHPSPAAMLIDAAMGRRGAGRRVMGSWRRLGRSHGGLLPPILVEAECVFLGCDGVYFRLRPSRGWLRLEGLFFFQPL